MAGAVMGVKKQTGKIVEKRGIWLNDSGTLSFGLAVEGEVIVEETEYTDVKKLSTEDRIKFLLERRKPKKEVELKEDL